jgi:hypothetical protein
MQLEETAYLTWLAQDVATSCGFDFVPPFCLRRGRGGDWNPALRYIRIGRRELSGDCDYLWYIVAHELAHAQAEQREGHSRTFWLRLSIGLEHANRLSLLKYGYIYRETAMHVAEEYGLPDVPIRQEFKLPIGSTVNDNAGRKWKIERRFRRAGAPYYRLKTRGWRWTTSESALLSEAASDTN